jgi:hypothetical protein
MPVAVQNTLISHQNTPTKDCRDYTRAKPNAESKVSRLWKMAGAVTYN